MKVLKTVLNNIYNNKITIKGLLIAITTLHLYGVEIEITNPQTTFIRSTKKEYTITAKKYIDKINAKDAIKILFFREKFFLANSYYEDGNFTKGKLFLKFKKAYKFSGKVNLYKVKGKFNDSIITAKKAIYKNNSITLYNCEIKSPKYILRRKKYKLVLRENSFYSK